MLRCRTTRCPTSWRLRHRAAAAPAAARLAHRTRNLVVNESHTNRFRRELQQQARRIARPWRARAEKKSKSQQGLASLCSDIEAGKRPHTCRCSLLSALLGTSRRRCCRRRRRPLQLVLTALRPAAAADGMPCGRRCRQRHVQKVVQHKVRHPPQARHGLQAQLTASASQCIRAHAQESHRIARTANRQSPSLLEWLCCL